MSSELLWFMSRLLWEIFIFTKISFPIPTNDMALAAELLKNRVVVWSIRGMCWYIKKLLGDSIIIERVYIHMEIISWIKIFKS